MRYRQSFRNIDNKTKGFTSQGTFRDDDETGFSLTSVQENWDVKKMIPAVK